VSRAATATIHLGALRANLGAIRARLPGRRVMAVVKADGYGHGLERVTRALADADAFGVASLQDGQRLRAAGVRARVVVLSGFDQARDLPELRRLRLEPVIHHHSQLAMIEAERAPSATPMQVWIELNTGMNRLGLPPAELGSTLSRLAALPQIAPQPILMSHLANSDVIADPANAAQIACFDAAHRGCSHQTSLANSAGALNFAQASGDWLRIGGLLYGISLGAGLSGPALGFAPAMTLHTRLIAINQAQAGDRVGYAGTFVCAQPMRLGVAAIGYGDGYPRHASNAAQVLVAGRRAQVVGRVSMDLITLDLSAHPHAQVGDPVVLWGRDLPVEELARDADTIGYELTCGTTRRVAFVEDHAPLPQTAIDRAPVVA